MSKKTASKSSSGKPAARAPRAAARPAALASTPRSTAPAPARGAEAPAKKPAARAGAQPAPAAAATAQASSAPVSSAQAASAQAASAQASKPAAAPAVPDVSPAVAPGSAVDTSPEVVRSGGGGAGDLADRIVASTDASSVASHAEHLMSDKPTSATVSARVLEELLGKKPEMLVPVIDKLVLVVVSGPKRSVQTAAAALPVMARLAPARVARHLPMLTEKFGAASEQGKDGLVSTFAALCTASVAYQKRLEPVLELALSSADPKTLQRWTETVLPSLKGEPHARARAVVEDRLHQIPRQHAQPIATFLGIKLRPVASR